MAAEPPDGPFVETVYEAYEKMPCTYRFYGRGVWWWRAEYGREKNREWAPAIVPEIPKAVFILISQLTVPA